MIIPNGKQLKTSAPDLKQYRRKSRIKMFWNDLPSVTDNKKQEKIMLMNRPNLPPSVHDVAYIGPSTVLNFTIQNLKKLYER